MERSFADATNCHGFKRARWRGLWKQAIQDLFIATAQNLRKLVKEQVKYFTPTNSKIAPGLSKLPGELTALLILPLTSCSAESHPFRPEGDLMMLQSYLQLGNGPLSSFPGECQALAEIYSRIFF